MLKSITNIGAKQDFHLYNSKLQTAINDVTDCYQVICATKLANVQLTSFFMYDWMQVDVIVAVSGGITGNPLCFLLYRPQERKIVIIFRRNAWKFF